MNWQKNINTIKEIFPGHFQIILDFATEKFLTHIIRDNYKFIWVYNHETYNFPTWQDFELPLFENNLNYKMKARNIKFDFILPTETFKRILSKLKNGISLAQVNNMPPEYLNLDKIIGKTRYDLLKKECDYLFEIDIPYPYDYGTLISPDKNYLQTLLENNNIDWSNLS